MHVRPIEYGSAEYAAACELRRLFLREPLGLELTAHDVDGEDAQHHFGLFTAEPGDEATLVGAMIGRPDDDYAPRADTVRLRQVVVHRDWRGQGSGRQMLLTAERLLTETYGYRRFVLFARDDAAPFYERNGYAKTGVTKELIGLPHWQMEKRV